MTIIKLIEHLKELHAQNATKTRAAKAGQLTLPL